MTYSKENKVLLDFLSENKTHWSFQDFKTVFKYRKLKKTSLSHFKYRLSNGVMADGQISKYKTQIIELCKVVTKRLADEKEILESIKMHQAVN